MLNVQMLTHTIRTPIPIMQKMSHVKRMNEKNQQTKDLRAQSTPLIG